MYNTDTSLERTPAKSCFLLFLLLLVDPVIVEKQTMSASYANSQIFDGSFCMARMALAYQTMPSHLVEDNDQTGLLL